MKAFWKIFFVSFIFFFIAIFLGSYSYIRTENNNNLSSNIIGGVSVEEENQVQIEEEKNMPLKEESYETLEEAFRKSNRINVIILGMEDVRTDTILFGSFDPDTKDIDVISIPRDTYIHRKGYDLAEQRKINSVYENHGAEGVKRSVSYVLQGAPVHHHIMVDYKGVEKIIDSVGGVEVVVPFHMKYSDPKADPPLHIDIRAGRQVLDGKKSLQFLRYRKGYIDGDLGRINAQQEFLKSFVKKALSYRLPVVIKNVYDYVESDISLFEALYYGTKALDISGEDIEFSTLPGQAEFRKHGGKLLSYFISNPSKTKKVLESIYNIEKPPNN